MAYFSLAILLIISTVTIAQHDETTLPYKNYRLVNLFHIENPEQLSILHKASETYDFWHLPKNVNDDGTTANATVMLSPQQVQPFARLIKTFNISMETITYDLSAIIELEREKQIQSAQLRQKSATPEVPLDYYARHDDINAYIDHLASLYPETTRVQSAGASSENRDLKYIRITNGRTTNVTTSNRRTIFVDAGMHAREWIAHATALYVIHQLVENAEENADLLPDGVQWIVLPCVNPDGYEYSHTTDRMWRKTRRPNPDARQCPGTDCNRNFDFHWGGGGASAWQCSETFRGPFAFSEPETQAVRDLLHAERDSCRFYLTLHSYGNYLLYPWGYTAELPKTWKDLDEVAQAGAGAIREATGTRYSVGSSTNVLYIAAGGSDDYALGAESVPISITMELPGPGGFIVAADRIRDIVGESWIGIRAMAAKVLEKYPN